MTRISNITLPVQPEDVPGHLLGLSAQSIALANQIKERLPRSDRTVALANFCSYVGGELRQVSVFYPANVPGLAWCARNLFETNLTVRHVLTSDENFRTWLGQTLQDEKDFIEGVLAVSSDQGNQAAEKQLRSRLTKLDEIASRHNLSFSKPFRAEKLAKSLGMHDEYVGLYKLFSKYVHPSSLLVNAWYNQKPESSWLDVFLVKAQIYAGDTIHRVADACELTT